ncbi:site-specific DNA-methyltransferase [Defluviimonas sp. SAOS-178_SWC]|uniref:site-specific DNA-methyltransferase n=1 Tax=Defluviimonas sp. SAOS-178_SWC TaxID=3121287 RepID=UPI003221F078
MLNAPDGTTTQLPPSIRMRQVSTLSPYAGNARTHSRRQIRQIADSITRFGFTNPVLIDDAGGIIAGHGRVAAAKVLGLSEVPTIALSHLSQEERRAYVLADNKLAENAGWDRDTLAIELQGLIDIGFDLEVTGFSLAEIDLTLDAARSKGMESSGREDLVPLHRDGPVVTRPGDLWQLGDHVLICGDARDPEAIDRLAGGQPIDLIFTDPPYNVPIDGHVSGLGRVRHREFAFASGEMSPAAFVTFLEASLGNAARIARDGAIAFVCMDWRHMGELLAAGSAVFSELKNLCVWNKTNAGMGTFYRSKHELVFVFKVGTGAHTNSFGLGDTGRYRTNVWDYAGVNVPGRAAEEALAMHPTVKPVALVADAIRDCSRRGEVVLDPFAGSGSTLIAAESCGRRARLVECDPQYCDVTLRRWQAYSGRPAVRAADGARFDDAEVGVSPAIEKVTQ